MEFVNREEDLAFPEKLYKEEASQFVVLYGRRRTGKTQLVKEFIEGKLAIYFLADSISESETAKESWKGGRGVFQ